jgi:two-component system, OmpR family, alkaline phosphatase synthesis response regulator PhoP
VNPHPRILVVDDEKDILEFLSYNLLKEGFEVFTSTNGCDGLNKAVTYLPDAIIADIRMPQMNGLEFCKKLRHEDKLKFTPLLFLTADEDELTALAAHYAGGTDFVSKPAKISIILNILKEMLHNPSVIK